MLYGKKWISTLTEDEENGHSSDNAVYVYIATKEETPTGLGDTIS